MELLSEGLVEEGVEGRVFAHDGLYNLTVGADQYLGGETLYAVVFENLAVARVVDVQPGQFMLLHGVLPLLFGVVAVYA